MNPRMFPGGSCRVRAGRSGRTPESRGPREPRRPQPVDGHDPGDPPTCSEHIDQDDAVGLVDVGAHGGDLFGPQAGPETEGQEGPGCPGASTRWEGHGTRRPVRSPRPASTGATIRDTGADGTGRKSCAPPPRPRPARAGCDSSGGSRRQVGTALDVNRSMNSGVNNELGIDRQPDAIGPDRQLRRRHSSTSWPVWVGETHRGDGFLHHRLDPAARPRPGHHRTRTG